MCKVLFSSIFIRGLVIISDVLVVMLVWFHLLLVQRSRMCGLIPSPPICLNGMVLS
jgi:hypothetical protein